MQARMDGELRTAIIRCAGARGETSREQTRRFGNEQRDDSVSASMFTSRGRREYPATNGAGGGLRGERNHRRRGRAERRIDAAAEILADVEFYELGQLHGLHPSVVYPAEHPKTGLSGDLMASMLTLSHFIKRAERAYEDDGASANTPDNSRRRSSGEPPPSKDRGERCIWMDSPATRDRGGGDGGHRARGHGRHSNVFERRGGGAAPTTADERARTKRNGRTRMKFARSA